MTTKNNLGQAVVEASISILFVSLFFVAAFCAIYLFSFKLATKYYSYQTMICYISNSKKLCTTQFEEKLRLFPGSNVSKIFLTKKDTRKSTSILIQWKELTPFYKTTFIGKNSVYIPKMLD